MSIDNETLGSALAQATWGNDRESLENLAAILRNGDSSERERLFKKFLLEGVPGAQIRALFDGDTIRSSLRSMVRHLPRSFQERRRKVWRHLYLGEHEAIPELDWVVPRH